MARATLRLALAATALAATPGLILAQGFQVNEHGTCVMGRAGVGVAKPCSDGSGIFFNPAGIARSEGVTLSAGVTGIYAYGGFAEDLTGRETDLANTWIPVPHAYATYGVTPQITAGLGFFVPYGLGTTWPLDTTLSAAELARTGAFEGRFNGYDSDLRSIYLQPTVAYAINDMLAIGAGLDIVIGAVELEQRVDLSVQVVDPATGATFGDLGIPFHTDFANGEIKASGATGIGGNFGIWFQPVDRVHLGARYLTRVTLDYTGTADFYSVPTGITLPPFNPIAVANPALDETQPLPLDAVIALANLFSAGQPLADQSVSLSITMPDQFTAGVAFDALPTLTLMADWQWVHWAVFDSLIAALEGGDTLRLHENYSNTNAFRVGFEWAAHAKLTVRGGYLHHQGAAPDETVTPLLPEGRRNEFTGGIGFRLTDQLTADLAYQWIRQNKRRGRVREPLPGQVPTTALNSGLYTFNAHLAAATFTVHF